jgi:hypothetical protein
LKRKFIEEFVDESLKLQIKEPNEQDKENEKRKNNNIPIPKHKPTFKDITN